MPRILSLENRRKIEPKEIPSCSISPLVVVFTRQFEILVVFLCMLNFKNLVSFFFSFFLFFFFTSQSHSSDKPTVPDKNSWDTQSKHCFFPFLCFPFPFQCCLLRFSHQIMYTNNGGTRRHKSDPPIDCSLMQSILGILYSVSQIQNFCILA